MDHARVGTLANAAGKAVQTAGTDLQGVGGPAVNTMMSGPATVPSYSQVRDRKLEPARPTGGALLGGIGRVIRSRTARYNQLIARDAEGFVPGSREAGD